MANGPGSFTNFEPIAVQSLFADFSLPAGDAFAVWEAHGFARLVVSDLELIAEREWLQQVADLALAAGRSRRHDGGLGR